MRENALAKNCLGFYNELGFKHPLFEDSSLSFLFLPARFINIVASRRRVKMASETKEEEEKEEEEQLLVSTKVPKARVRFIRLALRRRRMHRAFLFSLE